MIIEMLEVGPFAENCYVLGCEETMAGAVIDPGDEFDRIWQKVEERKLDIRLILLTHGHIDHVMQVHAMHEKTGAPVYMHQMDQFLLENLPSQAAAFGLTISGVPKVDSYWTDGDTVEFGQVQLEVVHTPGHSPGSVSLLTKGIALVGDALFSGSIGRTDLPGGDYETLISSIKTKLLTLSEETYIYPGHGPTTTIGRERAMNPFLT
jgi:glyoxylase-like metal-dependent hydrolase (beta-lactamase superfamily II)